MNVEQMTKIFCILLFVAPLTACTTQQIRFSSLEEIQQQVRPNVSTLPAYDLTGAIWVKGQPLLINHDFDFAMAMSLPDIGPGIAAAYRLKQNKENAKLFENMIPLSSFSEEVINKALQSVDTISLYGILFGHPEAHLKVILEVENNKDTLEENFLRYIYVTESLPVKGEDDSWSSENGQKIIESFKEAIPHLIAMWNGYPLNVEKTQEIEYTVTNGKVPQKGSGWVIANKDGRVLIGSTTIPYTFLSYPESSIKILNPFEGRIRNQPNERLLQN